MINSIFEKSKSSSWVRYTSYKIDNAKDGERYIFPDETAQPQIYKPLLVIDEILAAALHIGSMIASDGKYDDIEYEILEFYCRYGNLGLMMAYSTTADILGKSILYLLDNPITDSEMIKSSEYIKMFMPFIDAMPKFKITPLTKHTGKTPIYEVIFSHNYCENIEWIMDYFYSMYDHFYSSINIDKTTDNVKKVAFENRINGFRIDSLSFNIKYLTDLNLIWDFNSLKQSIDTAYAFNLTSKPIPLKICKFCSKIFFSKNVKSEFCSPQCRNKYNVYKTRGKIVPK